MLFVEFLHEGLEGHVKAGVVKCDSFSEHVLEFLVQGGAELGARVAKLDLEPFEVLVGEQ